MSSAKYTGNLTILGRGATSLSEYATRLRVRPEVEAFGPAGIVSSRGRGVVLDFVTGEFEVTLFPSAELTGADGRAGVRYVLELALFDTALDDSPMVTHDMWIFTAVAGGGHIKDMGNAPPNAFYVGPPWPATPKPGAFFDVSTGDLGFYGIGVL